MKVKRYQGAGTVEKHNFFLDKMKKKTHSKKNSVMIWTMALQKSIVLKRKVFVTFFLNKSYTSKLFHSLADVFSLLWTLQFTLGNWSISSISLSCKCSPFYMCFCILLIFFPFRISNIMLIFIFHNGCFSNGQVWSKNFVVSNFRSKPASSIWANENILIFSAFPVSVFIPSSTLIKNYHCEKTVKKLDSTSVFS